MSKKREGPELPTEHEVIERTRRLETEDLGRLLRDKLNASTALSEAKQEGDHERISELQAELDRIDLELCGGDRELLERQRLNRELQHLATFDSPRALLPERFRALPAIDVLDAFRWATQRIADEVLYGSFKYSADVQARAIFAVQVVHSVHLQLLDLLRASVWADEALGVRINADFVTDAGKEKLGDLLKDIAQGTRFFEQVQRSLRGMKPDREARMRLLESLAKYGGGWFDALEEFRRAHPIEHLNVTDDQFVEAARVLARRGNASKWGPLSSLFSAMGFGHISADSLAQEWKLVQKDALKNEGPLPQPLDHIPHPSEGERDLARELDEGDPPEK